MVKNRITMSGFGRWGRGGNQFFQYAFLTEYAKRHNAELQLPSWVGNHLFGFNDKPITDTLPPWMEPGSGLAHPTPPRQSELVNHDFHGYAQYHSSYFAPDKERIQNLFTPTNEIVDRLADAVINLCYGGCKSLNTVIGIHLGRGDYVRRIFPIIPTDWYLKWLSQHYDQRFGDAKVFISTEDKSLVDDFAEYNPIVVEDLGVELYDTPMKNCTYLRYDKTTKDKRAMDWYPDFYLLSHCDVILGPNSTFSFFAAMLNKDLKEFWRGELGCANFVKTDPWNAYPSLREHVRDYPHLGGISVPHNPYW